MVAEEVTTKLCNYFTEAIPDMFDAVYYEEYEKAAIIRDQIEVKINQVVSYIQKHKLSKLDREDIYNELSKLKWTYIRLWEGIMEIDEEDRLFNI